jgi:hypothetical protein
MDLDKTMKIIDLIETFEIKDFKITDVIHNDLYRHMNDAGLFDYDYIEKGQISAKGVKRKASKTNMVFLIWLMIAKDLKEFGMTNAKLHKVKDYLFTENKIFDALRFKPSKENFLRLINWTSIKDDELKLKLKESIKSGEFIESLKDRNITNIYLNIYKMLYTKSDIKLYVKADGESIFVDETELPDEDIKNLSYIRAIVLPLKDYVTSLIGEYASVSFLTRSRLLSEKEAYLIDEFRRSDIKRISIKYKRNKPDVMEVTKLKEVKMINRLTEVFRRNAFEDVTIKTANGNVIYSEITERRKFDEI